MKKNYLESILGFMTLILAISFLMKFINVNTESNETYDLRAKFLKAGGIIIGNDVKMRGVKIGVIKNVSLDQDFFAVIDFSVYKDVKVPQGSSVKIASDGILGNKYLSVIPENRDSKDFFKQGDNFVNVIDFESIEDQVSKIIFLATQ